MGRTVGAKPPKGLAGALFTPVQQRVLGLLFGQPDRRFQSAELIRLAAGGTGAVHRQLQRLADAGLVLASRQGSQKYYQANSASPIYPELHGLVLKTVAVVEPLRRALEPMLAGIHAAFVYGSTAKRSDRADSDVDLLVLSDALSYPEVYEALLAAEHLIARRVNPTVLTRAEWKRKRGTADSFAKRIAAEPKLFVFGDEDALA
jgi:predicted nucleotidyltransferase